MKIAELLQTYKVDRENIQAAGNMIVVPITSDIEFRDVADSTDITLVRDPAYEQLEFKNSGGKVGIIIQGWTMIEPSQQAQDRTVPYGQLIKAGSVKVVPANCVQPSQGGHFACGQLDQDKFMIMPPTLRRLALKNSSYTGASYSALWDDMGEWMRGAGITNGGLTSFYSQYRSNLDQFVAQFESVTNQLGSIVLINGQVVAIDVFPKYATWKRVWRPLIRDSYGAEAVAMASKESLITSPQLDLEEVNDLPSLKSAYERMKTVFYEDVQTRVTQVLNAPIEYKELDKTSDLTMLKLDGESFSGQTVLHGNERFVYLSLLCAGSKLAPRRRMQSLRRNPYGNSGFSFN
jgi:hypothetical protein